jgi:hypothetical protein
VAVSVEFRPPVGPPGGPTIACRSCSDFLKPQMFGSSCCSRPQSSAAIASRTVLSDANKYAHGRTRLIVLRGHDHILACTLCVWRPCNPSIGVRPTQNLAERTHVTACSQRGEGAAAAVIAAPRGTRDGGTAFQERRSRREGPSAYQVIGWNQREARATPTSQTAPWWLAFPFLR